jgi:hypothetical protein
MYDSFLLWTTGLFFSSSSSVEDRVDFKDVQYDSTRMRSLLHHRLPNNSSPSSSVWTAYWTSLVSRLSLQKNSSGDSFWQSVSYQSCSALFQSCHSDFLAFLYAKGQYAVVTRGCSISSLLTTTANNKEFPFAHHLLRCHEQTMVAISQLQSHLGDVVAFCSDGALEGDDLTPELCQSVESLLSIAILPQPALVTTGQRPLSTLTVAPDDGDKNLLLAHVRSWLDLQPNKAVMAPIADALSRLSERSSFRILFNSILRSQLSTDHPVDTLIDCFPALFLSLYELCHRSNSLTLLDRSRAVLPSSRSGDELTLAAAQATIDVLTRLSAELRREPSELSEALRRELELETVAVWSNVFNLAIHSHQLDRALEAVTTLRTLSHVSWTADALHWRGCLRTLIFTACTTGNIVWLCSLPDAIIGADGVTYIDLTQEIAVEMEGLARSSDLMSLPLSAGSESAEEVIASLASFYDCISSFLVCKRQLANCARLHYLLVERLGGVEELSTLSFGRLKLQQRSVPCPPPSD